MTNSLAPISPRAEFALSNALAGRTLTREDKRCLQEGRVRGPEILIDNPLADWVIDPARLPTEP